jgi:uncharacterized RDD family membrane protein YckC
MDIWLIRDGEKTGPVPDYEIRKRIESGDITAETHVWHHGLDGWTAISQVPLYRNHFDRADALTEKSVSEPVIAPGSDLLAPAPPPAPPPGVMRRFWARWLDLQLYSAFWWLSIWAAGRDVESIYGNPWLIHSIYVPWFVIETLLIHRFATTPGKWLLGIRVLNDDGSHLNLAAATWRSMRVLTIGIGLGWPILSLFCQAISLVTTRRFGKPVWDQFGGHRCTASPLKAWRILATITGFYLAMHLQMAVIAPYFVKQTQNVPQLKEFFDKNPPWHLPPRHR